MASVDSLITCLCPKLGESACKSTFIEMALAQTSADYFGVNYTMAVALRACHIFAYNGFRALGESGEITGKKEGGLSLNFSSGASGAMSELERTSYGMQLLSLMRSSGLGVSVTGLGGINVCSIT